MRVERLEEYQCVDAVTPSGNLCVCVCSLLTFIFNKEHDRSSAIKRNLKFLFHAIFFHDLFHMAIR